jgi:hypothetical protein
MSRARDVLTLLLSGREVIVPTEDQWFQYIKANWRGAYIIIRPSQLDDTWKALATFGNEDGLVADTPDELLDLIHHHYGPETEGYTEMLMNKIGKKYS